MTNKIKESLLQMIADGKTAGVVQQLLEITQYFGDGALENKAALLSKDYKAYREEAESLTAEQQALGLEKINQRVIELLDSVPAQGQEPKANNKIPDDADNQNQFSWLKLILILLVIAVILYVIFS